MILPFPPSIPRTSNLGNNVPNPISFGITPLLEVTTPNDSSISNHIHKHTHIY